MELTVRNNVCELVAERGLQSRSFLLTYATTHEKIKQKVIGRYGERKTVYTTNPIPLYLTYRLNEHFCKYVFPRGIFNLIPEDIVRQLNVQYNNTGYFNMSPDEVSEEVIRTSLQPESGFDLRDDQVMSVTKALLCKRGVIQLPTGGGKTEVMSSVIKLLKKKYPDIHVLVIEPTDVLVTGTTNRFNKYNLDAVSYKGSRNEIRHTVTVSHPTSLLNDLSENPNILYGVDAVFWDECQHCQCETWRKLNSALPNTEYSIGLSALAVDEKHLFCNDLTKLSMEEALIIGATGSVIMYVQPKYYIDKGILATPVVFQVENKLEGLDKVDDWHKLRKEGIESEERSELTADITKMFSDYGRRVLILVGTKNQAYAISEFLVSKGLSSNLALSFGGGESFTYDDNCKKSPYKEDIVHDFDQGKFSIMISTSHLDEGVDLSNLDVAILASGGKKDRRIIQRIGRALRCTKTGKYAYIIDFADKGNGVLEYHSALRMKLFEDVVEVPKDLVLKSVSIERLTARFKMLEGLTMEDKI